ncbi:MAG: HepT-like ribonuclease domain-containing protein [Candidatus Hydrogenedentota bacterium]
MSVLTATWTSVIGLRNINAHESGEIRHDKVWALCRDRLPALIENWSGRASTTHRPGEDG